MNPESWTCRRCWKIGHLNCQVNFTEILTKLLEWGASDADAMKFAKPIEAICQPLTVVQAMKAGLWRPATR